MRHALRALVVALVLMIAGIRGAVAQEWTAAPKVEETVVPPPAPPLGWQTEHGPFVRVHGAPEHYATVLRVARHASASLPVVAERLGVPIGDTIHLYVAGSDEEFRALQPGRAPMWADATAYPGSGTIYLRAPAVRGGTARPIEQVVDHELVHVLLGRAFAPNQPPHWLQEGVAQVVAGETSPETARELAKGLLVGELPSLGELSRGFPSDPTRARLAYAQSADFVTWLGVNHGEEALPALIRGLAEGRTIEAAVYHATGRFLEDIDQAWRAELGSGGFALTPLLNVDLLWAAGGVLLVAGGLLRRRRFHQRLREMEEEERVLDELLLQARGFSASLEGRSVSHPGAWTH